MMMLLKNVYRAYRAFQKRNVKRFAYAHLRSFIASNENVAGAYRNLAVVDTAYGTDVKVSRIVKLLEEGDEYRIRREKKIVVSGDWDLRAVPLTENIYRCSSVYRTISTIFEYNQPYKSSEEYQKKLHEILKYGRTGRGLSTVKQLDEYFDNLHRIFIEIEKHGYLPRDRKPLADRIKCDEVGVLIGRTGELIRPCNFGGSHRFSIVIILGVQLIPVRIIGVHPEYLNACARATSSKRLRALVRI